LVFEVELLAEVVVVAAVERGTMICSELVITTFHLTQTKTKTETQKRT
jgi:hypothetical protein